MVTLWWHQMVEETTYKLYNIYKLSLKLCMFYKLQQVYQSGYAMVLPFPSKTMHFLQLSMKVLLGKLSKTGWKLPGWTKTPGFPFRGRVGSDFSVCCVFRLFIWTIHYIYYIYIYISGQIITTSAEVTLDGGLVREISPNIPLIQV